MLCLCTTRIVFILYFFLIYFLTHLVSSNSKCIILGDFNFPDIVWSTLMGTSNSSNSFCNFVFECDLNQHVLEPTRVVKEIYLI